MNDRLRGEALFILVLTGLFLVLLMVHYLGWVLLESVLAEHPVWQRWFWGGQLVSVVLVGALALVGFRPAVQVTCTDETLEVTQGTRSLHLKRSSLNRVDRIPATQYYRHHRKYTATDVYVSRLPEQVLLFRTERGPVIVGLPETEQTALLHLLEVERASAAKSAIHET